MALTAASVTQVPTRATPRSTTMQSTTTINAIEMADLLLLLETVGDGYRLTKDRQRRAKELRESIIAGTPLGQRVSA